MARRGTVKLLDTKDDIERPVRYKKYLQFFLIACEDTKTEPTYLDYFKKQFPKETLFLKVVGVGQDPRNIIKKAIEERNRLKDNCLKEIDFVWAVFDKDDADSNQTKIKNYEEAFSIAQKEKINIAYSNEVFELWLLLHFKDIDKDTPLPRNQIYADLENIIKTKEEYKDFEYVHGDTDIIEIVIKCGNQKDAILRAKKLIDYHGDKKPILANPSTKMYELVEVLNDWITYHNYK